jgi:hypothetical protein
MASQPSTPDRPGLAVPSSPLQQQQFMQQSMPSTSQQQQFMQQYGHYPNPVQMPSPLQYGQYSNMVHAHAVAAPPTPPPTHIPISWAQRIGEFR